MKSKIIKWFFSILFSVIIIPLITWLILIKLEGGKPSLNLIHPSSKIGASQALSVSASDTRSGIKKIWMGLLKDGKEIVLLEENFSASVIGISKIHEKRFNVKVRPRTVGLTDGKAILRVVTRDFSWRNWGRGNKTYIEKEVMIDTRPPSIHVLSNRHNIVQGGSTLVIYKLSEPSLKNGVYVGENFFPGYSCPDIINNNNIFMALIALDYKQSDETKIFVEATDVAGNINTASFPYYIGKKRFKKDVINISDNFLNWKISEFEDRTQRMPQLSLLEKFLMINDTIRKENYSRFKELTKKSDNVIYWEGDFLRFPGKRMASFADHREYRYKGEKIDQQVHMGVDIASVSQAEVPASNRGKVVFAGSIGIYGETVIIDHGLGLFTTYSHLNDFRVQEGQMVSKGEIIGNTGVTGLAVGDHLHFGVLVHNTFVNPLEWWDERWVKNNISNKINSIKN